jgi:hypothetical protein
VEKVKLTKLPMACLIASTTHQDKEWSINTIIFGGFRVSSWGILKISSGNTGAKSLDYLEGRVQ